MKRLRREVLGETERSKILARERKNRKRRNERRKGRKQNSRVRGSKIGKRKKERCEGGRNTIVQYTGAAEFTEFR